MGRFGKTIRSFYPRPRRGQAYEELDLAAMRSPGAVYREPRPPRPHRDRLLYKETAYPQAPEPYREAAHYTMLGRWPYLPPATYEPDEPEWEYDDPPHNAFGDGARPVFDREPRERIPTYEDGLFGPGEAEELLRQAATDACVEPDFSRMPGGVTHNEPHGDMGFAVDAAAPAAVPDAQDNTLTMESLVDAPGDALGELAYGGLEHLVLGEAPEEGPCAVDAWGSMGGDVFQDEVAAAEHAFDQQLEDVARESRQQEQAFAEPDWGPSALVPEPTDPEPPEPPDPFLQPPSPPGLGRFPF